ncbi:MAG TPA: hypothetical protein ENI33_01090 [Thermoplasmatales archaeon]|nr:hypothetical protein [Thermoplasmatales archaeon]
MIDEEIKKEMEKFNWLIDEETAKLLVMEKQGKINLMKITDLKEGNVSLYAKIESMGTRKKNFMNAIIGDETGFCLMKLWDHNVNFAHYLKEGDVVRIANAWVRKGIYGIEINVGKYGMIEKTNKKIKTSLQFGIKEGIFNIKGVLNKKYPTQVYIGEKETFIRRIKVDDMEIYLINEMAKKIQNVEERKEITLLWLHKKNNRIYADELSKIK